ncbi:MAG TPA: hypothetical protein VN656_16680 [Stellaceae bacterium]|jgi:hypothetical protein|nr:hypothetical protein [Stellaceae bacterium]
MRHRVTKHETSVMMQFSNSINGRRNFSFAVTSTTVAFMEVKIFIRQAAAVARRQFAKMFLGAARREQA